MATSTTPGTVSPPVVSGPARTLAICLTPGHVRGAARIKTCSGRCEGQVRGRSPRGYPEAFETAKPRGWSSTAPPKNPEPLPADLLIPEVLRLTVDPVGGGAREGRFLCVEFFGPDLTPERVNGHPEHPVGPCGQQPAGNFSALIEPADRPSSASVGLSGGTPATGG